MPWFGKNPLLPGAFLTTQSNQGANDKTLAFSMEFFLLIDGLYEKTSEYILMVSLVVTQSSIFFLKRNEAESSVCLMIMREIWLGIWQCRYIPRVQLISFSADGDTVSGFHYELFMLLHNKK